MKKLSILTTLFLFVFLFQAELTHAQFDEDLFSFMKEYLSNDEASQVERAKSSIGKAENMNTSIRAEDKKIEKYFKKKKKKKAEKKAVDVKILRIKQALYYDKAYTLIYNVYSEKIAECKFYFDADEAKVYNLIEGASSDVSGAKAKIKIYRKVSPKDLKKKHPYSKLKSDLSSGINSEILAINKLIQAYSIFIDQESKKQMEDEEKRVWNNSVSENSVISFQTYLDEYSNGKYASQARMKINSLQAEEARIAEEELERQRSLAGSIVFEVQIAASRKQLPKGRLAKFYRATNDIKTKHYDNWYKYSVGEFETYEGAKAFIKKIRVRGAFVVAYKNDQKIDIVEAISVN
ncbi:MAG: hypothetical protein B6I20_04845 [Bacteroidetes bacterium 4572_117]|nr:MAG: hypothetical protein B6I20_04845 [Bacteroidetes bacterium 4572_117]